MTTQPSYPHIDDNWKIKYKVIENESIQDSPVNRMALNVSGGGLSFKGARRVDPGTLLALEMRSPDFEVPVLAMAKAVRCKERQVTGTYDLEAEFWWVGWNDDAVQESIARFIRQQTR